MFLVYDEGAHGRHRYGPINTVIKRRSLYISLHKDSSPELAQVTADLLTLPQDGLLDHQLTALTQLLIGLGRQRIGRRFDRLVAGNIVRRLRDTHFIIHF